MNLYTGLLFQHGHIQDPKLAITLAAEPRGQRPGQAEGRPRLVPRRDDCARPYRRGGIASVCSVALSPFR